MQACTNRINVLESHNSQLSGTVAQKEESYTNASREIDNLGKKLRFDELNCFSSENKAKIFLASFVTLLRYDVTLLGHLLEILYL